MEKYMKNKLLLLLLFAGAVRASEVEVEKPTSTSVDLTKKPGTEELVTDHFQRLPKEPGITTGEGASGDQPAQSITLTHPSMTLPSAPSLSGDGTLEANPSENPEGTGVVRVVGTDLTGLEAISLKPNPQAADAGTPVVVRIQEVPQLLVQAGEDLALFKQGLTTASSFQELEAWQQQARFQQVQLAEISEQVGDRLDSQQRNSLQQLLSNSKQVQQILQKVVEVKKVLAKFEALQAKGVLTPEEIKRFLAELQKTKWDIKDWNKELQDKVNAVFTVAFQKIGEAAKRLKSSSSKSSPYVSPVSVPVPVVPDLSVAILKNRFPAQILPSADVNTGSTLPGCIRGTVENFPKGLSPVIGRYLVLGKSVRDAVKKVEDTLKANPKATLKPEEDLMTRLFHVFGEGEGELVVTAVAGKNDAARALQAEQIGQLVRLIMEPGLGELTGLAKYKKLDEIPLVNGWLERALQGILPKEGSVVTKEGKVLTQAEIIKGFRGSVRQLLEALVESAKANKIFTKNLLLTFLELRMLQGDQQQVLSEYDIALGTPGTFAQWRSNAFDSVKRFYTEDFDSDDSTELASHLEGILLAQQGIAALDIAPLLSFSSRNHAVWKGTDFPACAENALRTFLYSILFDPRTKKLTLDFLPPTIKVPEDSPLRAFVEKHGNLTSYNKQEAEQAWLMLIEGIPGIGYARGAFELIPRVKNITLLIAHLFGIDANILEGKTDIKKFEFLVNNLSSKQHSITVAYTGPNTSYDGDNFVLTVEMPSAGFVIKGDVMWSAMHGNVDLQSQGNASFSPQLIRNFYGASKVLGADLLSGCALPLHEVLQALSKTYLYTKAEYVSFLKSYRTTQGALVLPDGLYTTQMCELMLGNKISPTFKAAVFEILGMKKELEYIKRLLEYAVRTDDYLLLMNAEKLLYNTRQGTVVNTLAPSLINLALTEQKLSCLKYLVERGYALTQKQKNQGLLLAIKQENVLALKLFFEKGADVNALYEGKTLLEWALAEGKVESLLYFAKNKILTFSDEQNLQVLLLAAKQENMPALSYFIESNTQGLDASQKNLVIDAALTEGKVAVLRYCLQKDFTFSPEQKMQALFLAIKKSSVILAFRLLEAGAEVDAPYEGKTPIEIALENFFLPVVKVLIQKGATLTDEQKTFLLCDANNYPDDESLIRTLILQGADLNRVYEGNGIYKGKTPLAVAFDFNNYNIVKLLMESGARSTQEQQVKAFLLAVTKKDFEFQYNLLKSGLDINTTVQGIKLFDVLIEKKAWEAFQNLLQRGFPFTDIQKKALMDYAADSMLIDLQKLLIEKGMDVNGIYGSLGDRYKTNLIGLQLLNETQTTTKTLLFLLNHGVTVLVPDQEALFKVALEKDNRTLLKKSLALPNLELTNSIFDLVINSDSKSQDHFIDACSPEQLLAAGMYAVEYKDVIFLQTVIQKIVELQTIDLNTAYKGKTLLDVCIQGGSFGSILDTLLAYGARLSPEQKATALALVISRKSVNLVEKFIRLGANVLEEVDGMTPLERANIELKNATLSTDKQGYEKIIKLLQEAIQRQTQ